MRFLPTTQITVVEDRVQIQHCSGEDSDSRSLFGLKNSILVLFIDLPLNILKNTNFPNKFICIRISNGQ